MTMNTKHEPELDIKSIVLGVCFLAFGIFMLLEGVEGIRSGKMNYWFDRRGRPTTGTTLVLHGTATIAIGGFLIWAGLQGDALSTASKRRQSKGKPKNSFNRTRKRKGKRKNLFHRTRK